MTGHTPTPWERTATHIYSPGKNGGNVCTVSEPRASGTVGFTELRLGSADADEAFANAELIVRAVNRADIAEEALNVLKAVRARFQGLRLSPDESAVLGRVEAVIQRAESNGGRDDG